MLHFVVSTIITKQICSWAYSSYFLSLFQGANLVHLFSLSLFFNHQCFRIYCVLVPFVPVLDECVSHSLPGCLYVICPGWGFVTPSCLHHVSLCGSDHLLSTLFCSYKDKRYAATWFPECAVHICSRCLPLPAEAGLQKHTIVNKVF